MKPRPTREIRASLLKKGFQEDQNHHVYFWLYVNGQRTQVRTRYSHGAKECDDYIQRKMAEQLGLEKKEFEDLINCPLQHSTLVNLLVKRGLVKRS